MTDKDGPCLIPKLNFFLPEAPCVVVAVDDNFALEESFPIVYFIGCKTLNLI